jgi:HEPN domain-containing protein
MSELIDHIKEWIYKADHDLGSAKVIYRYLPDYFDTIAFHCQQAVEKYIKAILVFYNTEFQRSHDLIYLLDLLSRKIEISDEIYNKAITLNGFSVEIRYPAKKIYLSKEELEFAIKIAQEFRIFSISIIGITD